MDIELIEIIRELKSLIQQKVSNRWMNIHVVAQYSSVSLSTIRRAVRTGRLKASNTTGKLLFKVSEVEKWLNG